jgi:hypothetical protein
VLAGNTVGVRVPLLALPVSSNNDTRLERGLGRSGKRSNPFGKSFARFFARKRTSMADMITIATGVSVAVAIGVVMPMLVSGQKKKLARIEPLLRERGGMTLDEVAKELGTNIVAKGYLMQALDAMVAEGKLVKIPPPDGHPRMRIFKDTKYAIAA